MASHFSILAWRRQWTEEPCRLQSMWSQTAGHESVTNPPPQLTSDLMVRDRKLPPEIQTKTGMSLSQLVFSIVLGALASKIRHGKKKDPQVKEEERNLYLLAVKLSLSKISQKLQNEPTITYEKFIKLIHHKTQIKKSVVFFCQKLKYKKHYYLQ